MPLYDYECRNCGHRVEVLHGVNESGPAACQRCGGNMRKLLSAPAIVFKGSGWAKKDFREARSTGKPDKEAVKAGSGDAASDTSGSDRAVKADSSGAAKSTDGAAKQTASKSSTPAKAAD